MSVNKLIKYYFQDCKIIIDKSEIISNALYCNYSANYFYNAEEDLFFNMSFNYLVDLQKLMVR